MNGLKLLAQQCYFLHPPKKSLIETKLGVLENIQPKSQK